MEEFYRVIELLKADVKMEQINNHHLIFDTSLAPR